MFDGPQARNDFFESFDPFRERGKLSFELPDLFFRPRCLFPVNAVTESVDVPAPLRQSGAGFFNGGKLLSRFLP
jgi:hypothetical protein